MTVALLIIDQQKGLDHPKLGNRNNFGAEGVMLELLALFREKALPVVHIKHRSAERESVFWPEQEGFDFKEAFQPFENESVLEKAVPCAFVKTNLEERLKLVGAQTVVIVGAATNNSVESSVRTAGNLGFNVLVVEDACFSYEKVDYLGRNRTADDVHIMSISNMDREYATVTSSAELLSNYLSL